MRYTSLFKVYRFCKILLKYEVKEDNDEKNIQ